MEKTDGLRPWEGALPAATVRALEGCNRRTARFGLALSGQEMAALAEGRTRALRDAGRVELGEGILPRLVLAFCDSPDLHQEDYAQTLLTLQEVFYAMKTAFREQISDDALLALMRRAFDETARGAAEVLAGMTPEELLGREEADDDEP